MKVVMFVSNAFVSDPRVYSEAKSLVQAGFKVTVIAWDTEKRNPPRQNWDGIEVIRLRTRLLPKFRLLLWQWQAYRQALIY